jgi:hypothetical protein
MPRINYSNFVQTAGELPGEFNAWIARAGYFRRYMFLTKTPTGFSGRCSYCKNEVPYNKRTTPKPEWPVRGKTGVCPRCGQDVLYRSVTDRTMGLTAGQTFAAYIERIDNTAQNNFYLIRMFDVRMHTDYMTDRITAVYELQRDLFDSTDGKTHSYHKRIFDGGYYDRETRVYYAREAEDQWLPSYAGAAQKYISMQDLCIYPNNLPWLLAADGRIRYSALDILAARGANVNPAEYLAAYLKNPLLELVVKSGLIRIAEHIGAKDLPGYNLPRKTSANYDIGAETPAEFLRLKSRDYIKFAVTNGVSNGELQAVQFMERWALPPDKPTYDRAREIFRLHMDYSYGKLLPHMGLDAIDEYCDRVNASVNDYADYIGNCVKLDRDMTDSAVLRPNDFKTAHDRAAERVKIAGMAIYRAKFKTLYKTRRTFYEYECDGLKTVLPKTPAELVREGKTLSHCVGGYADRVAAGHCVIVFIRAADKPGEPYYTMELRGTDLIQCRGHRNVQYTNNPAIAAFVGKYLAELRKRAAKPAGAARKGA